jgi:hypothetical protein
MGEAKRRRLAAAAGAPVVYHHTSTLRTNMIWMSGVIDLEGRCPPVLHPQLGEITTSATRRRAMSDFPALAWFTTRIAIPQCLQKSELMLVDPKSGEPLLREYGDAQLGNALALHRLALGFPVAEIGAVRWRDHAGYTTSEGRELNVSAVDAGDDPNDWYVSETPVEILKSTEVWGSKTIQNPRLTRWDWYLKDIHHMVKICREQGVYIPPTWLNDEQAKMVTRKIGLPSVYGSADASKRSLE